MKTYTNIVIVVFSISICIAAFMMTDKYRESCKKTDNIEYPAIVISIESYDEELNTYTIRGLNKVETEFRDQCGRHLLNDTVRVETVTR